MSGQPCVGRDRLADDRVGLLPQGRCHARAVGGHVSHGSEPGQHPVHRVPDRRRRRGGVAERVRGPEEDRAPRERGRQDRPLRRQGQPARGQLAEQRRTPDDGLAERLRDLRPGEADHLDQLVGEPPLVQQHHLLPLDPERASPCRGRAGRRDEGLGNDRRGRRLGRPEEHARHPGRAFTQGTGRPHDRRRGLHRVAGERPEEPAAGEPHGLVRVGRGRGLGRRGLGCRAHLVGHDPSPARARVSR